MKFFGVTIDKSFAVKAVATGVVLTGVGMLLRFAGSQVGGTVGDLAKKAADVVD